MRKPHHICAEDRESTGVPCVRAPKATKATTDASQNRTETRNKGYSFTCMPMYLRQLHQTLGPHTHITHRSRIKNTKKQQEVIILRTEGEIRKKLRELEESREEVTEAPYSAQKRISLHAEIKMLRWVLEEKIED